MELNGKAGNPGLAANTQIQNLQHAIEFSQIVVDQMDGKIGRLLHWINPEQPGDVESSRQAMRLQLIDLHPAPTLEVLGIEVSAERNLARGIRRGSAHGKHRCDGKIIRRSGPINTHVALPGGIEAQIPVAWLGTTLSRTVVRRTPLTRARMFMT